MKKLQVHILPTKEASHVVRYRTVLQFTDKPLKKSNPQHIYLTDDSWINDGDWYLDTKEKQVEKCGSDDEAVSTVIFEEFEKIVATTDPKLGETLRAIPGGFKPLASISEEDIPKIIELWNRGVKEVECDTREWRRAIPDINPMNMPHLESEIKLNNDGSIKLVLDKSSMGIERIICKRAGQIKKELDEDNQTFCEASYLMGALDFKGQGIEEVTKLLNALIAARSMMLDDLQYNEESVPVIGIDELISKYK